MQASLKQDLMAVLARELHGLCKSDLTQGQYATIVDALLRELVTGYFTPGKVVPSERSKNTQRARHTQP
jgi:hypothetical protein